MRTLRRIVIAAGLVAILLYSGAVAFMMSQETRLVFLPHTTLGSLRPNAPFEQVEDPFGWIMRTGPDATDRPWIIFFHGNDSTIASRLNIEHYERLRQLGLNVFAPEYPGFGGVDGSPSELSLERTARIAYEFVRSGLKVPPERIIVYGWSLGSAVAVDLTSHVPEAAVVLEGAPASIAAVGEQRYPWLPVRMVIRNPFESIAKVGGVHAPLLFLHSPQDEIVPIEEGRRLFAAAHDPKQFVEVSGGHVYASERDPHFFNAVKTFLAAHGLVPGE
jgi:pimeloyl-ACP methyl ester carboxylesterase